MLSPTTYKQDIANLLSLPHLSRGYFDVNNERLRLKRFWSATVLYMENRSSNRYETNFLVSVITTDKWIKGVLLTIEDEFEYSNQKPEFVGYVSHIQPEDDVVSGKLKHANIYPDDDFYIRDSLSSLFYTIYIQTDKSQTFFNTEANMDDRNKAVGSALLTTAHNIGSRVNDERLSTFMNKIPSSY